VVAVFSALRQARLLHRFSLDEAASAAKVTGGHLSRIERGYAPVSPVLAERLARLYKIRIEPSSSRERRNVVTQSRRKRLRAWRAKIDSEVAQALRGRR
jgi:transcriptional regulator with XRE-family HTH domain